MDVAARNLQRSTASLVAHLSKSTADAFYFFVFSRTSKRRVDVDCQATQMEDARGGWTPRFPLVCNSSLRTVTRQIVEIAGDISWDSPLRSAKTPEVVPVGKGSDWTVWRLLADCLVHCTQRAVDASPLVLPEALSISLVDRG